MPERPCRVLGHRPSKQTFHPASRCFRVSPVCWQPCWVNTGHMMVNPTDVAPAFMALPDHGQGCPPWDLLSLKLPWKCRRGPRPSSPPGIPRPGKTLRRLMGRGGDSPPALRGPQWGGEQQRFAGDTNPLSNPYSTCSSLEP